MHEKLVWMGAVRFPLCVLMTGMVFGCADNRLLLSSINLQHGSHRKRTWRFNSASSLIQIDHISVSCRWPGSVQNRKSYWTMYVKSHYTLVQMRLLLRLGDHRCRIQTQLAVGRVGHSHPRQLCSGELRNLTSSLEPNAAIKPASYL